MIVYNLYAVDIAVFPLKTNPPSLIYPNTVLSCAVPSQFFEAIGRWNAQVIEGASVVQHSKFA